MCNVLTISAQLETRTKESKHVCKFLTIFTHLEPTAIEGGLWFACEGTGVSTGGRARSPAPLFMERSKESTTCVPVFVTDNMKKVNVWICARRTTTDHDLASVSLDKKESK